jgi:vacuolar protein sorting-associated protein 54
MSQQEKSLILARNLRALEAEDAEEMFMNIYAAVGEACEGLSQLKVLLDITSGISSTPATAGLRYPPKSPNNPTLDGYLDPRGLTLRQ